MASEQLLVRHRFRWLVTASRGEGCGADDCIKGNRAGCSISLLMYQGKGSLKISPTLGPGLGGSIQRL